MKVTCESCGAVYRIPEEKLTKEVSRATCKKCGAKIIIRRPSATEDGLDDLRVGVGQSAMDDEDSVIDHEERTVIAHVPELQRFDATPPLSTGAVSSHDELGSAFGQAPSSPAAPAPKSPFGTQPGVEEEYQEKTEVRPSSVSGAPVAKLGDQTPPPLQSSPKAPAPVTDAPRVQTPVVPAPKITAETSPARPSGNAGPTAATPPPPVKPAPAPKKKKADVVEIFSHDKKPEAAKDEFRQPVPKILLGLLGVAFLGVLAFVHHGLWGLTKLTAAGFFVALYGILSTFVAQWDLSAGRRINYAKVFLVPAVACVALFFILVWLQSDDLAFMYPDVDIKLVQRWIRERPEVPEGVADKSLDTRIAATYRKHKKPRNHTIRKLPVQATPTKSTEAEAKPEPSLPPGVDPSLLIGRSKSSLPKSDFGAVARVNLNTEAIEKELERLRVHICFDTHSRGYDASGKITFRVLIDPDGHVRQAAITDPERLSHTALEQCMVDKVVKASFPKFNGSKPEWYNKIYYR